MKREEVLKRLGFTVPDCKKKRVIIASDVNCEADDPFAIMHHLLTPSFEVKGIIACHFEYVPRSMEAMAKQRGEGESAEGSGYAAGRFATMDRSYAEGELILQLAGIDDVPLLRGAKREISEMNDLPESEGADFIIEEALRDDPRPLYVCMLGGETDLAIAYLKKPEIAKKVIAVGILGGVYPEGGWEFNLVQDIKAVNTLFQSPMEFWQIPMNVYGSTEISFAELVRYIRPCGEIGKWLVGQMLEFQQRTASADRDWPNPEMWSIGDNPTVGVLLQGEGNRTWHTRKAPRVGDDCTYTEDPDGKEIRVYDSYDVRMTLSDLIAKLQLCYGNA